MKKKVLAVFLAVAIVLSTTSICFTGLSSGIIEEGSEELPYIIETEAEFLDFLTNANSSSNTYYKLGADIVATDTTVIKGHVANKVHLDGCGYTISGYTVEGALFSKMKSSSVRNVVFSDITATFDEAQTENVAVIAQETDYNSYITNCSFENCTLDLQVPQGSVSAAFVAVQNSGSITSCMVLNNNSIDFGESTLTETSSVAGVAVDNDGYITGCISRIGFAHMGQINFNDITLNIGGITAASSMELELCYAEVQSPDLSNDNINFGYLSADDCSYSECYYKVDSNIFNADGTVYEYDIITLAAELSTAVHGYNSFYQNMISVKDFAKLFSVDNNGKLFISADDKEGFVTITIDSNFYDASSNSEKLKSVTFVPTDPMAKVIYSDESENRVSKIITRVGYTDENGDYVRNSVNVSAVCENDLYVVNAVILKLEQNYMTKCDDVFNPGEKYAKNNFFDSKHENGTSTSEVLIYPCDSTITITSATTNDQITPFIFDGEGTDESPFEIETESDLSILSRYIAERNSYEDINGEEKLFANASYILKNDIDIKAENFAPIGKYSSAYNQGFSGTFDGDFHKITNINIKSSSAYQGFFGLIYGTAEKPAVIKNLMLIDANVVNGTEETYGSQLGLLAGCAVNAKISGCIASGSIYGSTQLGGLVGYATSTEIVNCGTNVNIHSHDNYAYVGGITGYAQYSKMYNSYSISNVDVSNVLKEEYLSIGGIAGFASGSEFYSCYKNCTVKSQYSDYLKAEMNYEGISGVILEKVTDKDFLAALIRVADAYVTESQWGEDTEGIFNSMPVPVSRDNATYFIAPVVSSEGKLESDNLMVKAGETVTLTAYGDFTGVEITDMRKEKLDVDVTFENGIVTFEMPKQSVRVVPISDNISFVGMGSEDDPFVISTYEQLVLMSEKTYDTSFKFNVYEVSGDAVQVIERTYSDCVYVLDADIDGSKTSATVDGYSPFWTANTFNGTFDGQGHTISNLTIGIDDTKWSSVSFFYKLDMSAEVKNVNFENFICVNPRETETKIGLLAFSLSGRAEISNVSMKDFTVTNCQKSVVGFVAATPVSYIFDTPAEVYNCYFENISTDASATYKLIADTGAYSETLVNANNCIFVGNYSDIGYAPEEYYTATNCYTYSNTSKLTDEVIADMSKNAEDISGASLWCRNDNDIYLATAERKAFSHIFVDSVFSDSSQIKLFDLDSIPEYGTEGETITVKFYRNTSLVDFRLLCRGEAIPYSVSSEETDVDGWGEITFVMPEGSVTFSNNGADTVMIIPGHGTEESPYIISSGDEIKWIGKVMDNHVLQYKWDDERYVNYCDAYFILEKDIDVNGAIMKTIGQGTSSFFRGTFDGNFHTISNINFEKGGLFYGVDTGGVVKNLYIDNAYADAGSDKEAAIIARYNKGTISKCMIKNSKIVTYDEAYNVSFVAGYNFDTGVIDACAVVNSNFTDYGVVSHPMYYASRCAGVVDINYGKVSNCYVYNLTLQLYSAEATGIIANNNGIAENNYYFLNSNSYQVGLNTNEYRSQYAFNSGEVTYSLNKGVTDGTQTWYQDIDNGCTPEEYPDFENSGINTVYNVSRSEISYSNINLNDFEIYEIGTPEELILFSAYVNSGKYDAPAMVVADIDMTGYEYTPIAPTGLFHSADPVEDSDWGYKGIFDGQGHVISNLTLVGSSSQDLSFGLFGTVSGTVKNIGLENFKYTGAGMDSRVGAVAGQVISGGKIIDCYVKNCDINTKVNTTNGVAGGIAGSNYAGEISSCFAYNVVINAGRQGNVVSDNYGDGNNADGTDRPGKVINCYTDGTNICGRGNAEGGYANIPETVLESGEITYLLSDGRDVNDTYWRQGEDNLPGFKGFFIYQNLCEGDKFYSTVDKDYEFHSIDDGYVRCNNCHNFDAATLITEENYEHFGLTEDYVGLWAVENSSNMYWMGERKSLYNLTGGIVLLDDITINSNVEPWIPMHVDGDYIFDGRGNTINLNLDFGKETVDSHMGIFSVYNYAIIRDVVLDGYIKGSTSSHMGGFSATMYRSTVTKVLSYADVTNYCETSGSAGGIAGYFGGQHSGEKKSLIENCAVYADVTGYNAGGLVGHGWNGKQYYDIKNCAYAGNVTGISCAGAVIGYHGNNQTAYHCTFTDIYYLEDDNLGFSGGGNTNYTLDETNVTSKSLEQFESGEVCYLLNNKKSSGDLIWLQTLGTDKYPLFEGDVVLFDDEYYNSDFIIDSISSQIRFDCNDDGSYAETFAVRTRAIISDEDFAEFIAPDETTAEKRIKKAGFVYSINPESFSTSEAQKVARGEMVSGYTDAPVRYIQDKEGYYMFTCIVVDIPYYDRNNVLVSYAYICVEDENGNECWYFMNTQAEADFEKLYSVYFPIACETFGWKQEEYI